MGIVINDATSVKQRGLISGGTIKETNSLRRLKKFVLELAENRLQFPLLLDDPGAKGKRRITRYCKE